jgi:colanic acid biosynthesis glycosyl transferase WcaI
MDKRLRILYISHYFPPEVNAPAVRVSEMAERWARQGADVTVLTCFPNHPGGIIPEKYRGYKRLIEVRNNVRIVRTYVYAAPNDGIIKRTLNFLSFMLSSITLGFRPVGNPDVIISTSPQFFVAVAGYILSRLKRCKFIFEVRDVWPEEIVAVGVMKNGIAIKMLEAIEVFLYKKADLIVTVAHGTMDILAEKGISPSKMALVPNGVSISLFQSGSGGESIRRKLGKPNDFIVGYIGTHGMAHRLDIVLEAAEILRNVIDIAFLFVGDGADKNDLMLRASNLRLPNVIFHDQVDRADVPDYYGACDVCLVPLRKADLFTKNIPSKIYEIMAAAKPIIFSTEGESRSLIENAGAGLAARPEDAADLAEKIMILYNNRGLCRGLGKSGYSFALANCSRDRLADQYFDVLLTIIGCEGVFSKAKQKDGFSEDINIPHDYVGESAELKMER